MDDEKDLTRSEEEIEEATGASAEEAHRVGEFDGIVERLERIERSLETVAGAIDDIRTVAGAVAVDNGAEFIGATDEDAVEADEPEVIEIPDYDDLDLDI